MVCTGDEGARSTYFARGADTEGEGRYLVPAVRLPWAVDLVDRVGIQHGDRLLDAAC